MPKPKPKYVHGRLQVATAFIHFTDLDGNLHVMLGRRQHGKRYGNYTFPGGNVDDTGETPEEAAFREVKEETHFDLTSKRHPITGALLQLKSEIIQYEKQGKSPAKDIHVTHVDLGQLSHKEIAKLKKIVRPADDLAEVHFMSQPALAGKSITGQNLRIINEHLSANPSQRKITASRKSSIHHKSEIASDISPQKRGRNQSKKIHQKVSVAPPEQTHSVPISPQHKWSLFKHAHDKQTPTPQVKSLFIDQMEIKPLTLKEIRSALQKGIIPLKSDKETTLDHYIRNGTENDQNSAADLLIIYSVKNIMRNLNTLVKIEMVDNNNRAKVQGHDMHAMKIQFKSQTEAKEFAKKLFEEHGIHSHTFGHDVMKTPQNSAIYLTPNDFEKITHNAKLSSQSSIGVAAYNIKAKSYEHEKSVENDSSLVENNGAEKGWKMK